jgi:hypothetical protein
LGLLRLQEPTAPLGVRRVGVANMGVPQPRLRSEVG